MEMLETNIYPSLQVKQTLSPILYCQGPRWALMLPAEAVEDAGVSLGKGDLGQKMVPRSRVGGEPNLPSKLERSAVG